MEALALAALAAGVGTSTWLAHRGRLMAKFLGDRRALVRAARAHGGIAVAHEWLTPKLSIERDGRTLEAIPCTLGVLRDDPPYTWWRISTSTNARVGMTFHVCMRAWHARWTPHREQHLLESGDDAFEARHVAYLYHPSPEGIADARAILLDDEVRQCVRDLLADDTDDCTLGAYIWITRRRVRMSLDDLLRQVELAASLARAIERIFAQGRYR